MITQEILSTLTGEEKDQLILEQAAQIRALEARIADLEALDLEALIGFKKNSKNSSIPPHRIKKGLFLKRRTVVDPRALLGGGHARDLHKDTDETVESQS